MIATTPEVHIYQQDRSGRRIFQFILETISELETSTEHGGMGDMMCHEGRSLC